jgi:cytochrome c oxidase assembly protein subunit 15
MFIDQEYETTLALRKIRPVAILALAVAVVHVVFGAVVRITGSGMGCGDHWPTCNGYLFPPMSRPELVVEVSHRYLATILTISVVALVVAAWRQRYVHGIADRGGPLRSAYGALGAVVAAALLGAVTVKLHNTAFATVAHWCVAMTLLAMLIVTMVRSTTGPDDDRRVSAKTMRGSIAAAVMAGLAVAMGGMTAKYIGAPIACRSFPLCGTNPDVPAAAAWIQIIHRTIAILLILHLIGQMMGVRKRNATEAPIVVQTVTIACILGLLQFLIAGAMIGMKLPPVLRSTHQAVGVSIWISSFAYAYMSWLGSRPVAEPVVVPVQRASGPRKTIARSSLSQRELE